MWYVTVTGNFLNLSCVAHTRRLYAKVWSWHLCVHVCICGLARDYFNKKNTMNGCLYSGRVARLKIKQGAPHNVAIVSMYVWMCVCVHMNVSLSGIPLWLFPVLSHKTTIIRQAHTVDTFQHKFTIIIQGGPERMQHCRSIISRKRGTEWNSCVHYCV